MRLVAFTQKEGTQPSTYVNPEQVNWVRGYTYWCRIRFSESVVDVYGELDDVVGLLEGRGYDEDPD